MPTLATGRKMAVHPRIIPDRPPGCRARLCQGGFTLIELIVVIVIVGILAGFAVMSLNRTAPDGVAVCRADAQRWLTQQAVTAAQHGETVYIGSRGDALTSFMLSRAPRVQKNSGALDSMGTEPVGPDALDVLHWAKGCRIETVPDTALSTRFAANDPRRTALLAVTAQGLWSAPTGVPTLVLRGKHRQEQALDLSPSPATEMP